jgi:hypothetical protein
MCGACAALRQGSKPLPETRGKSWPQFVGGDVAAPGAMRPPRRGRTRKFAVLNTVLILKLERWRGYKLLKSLARHPE